jgi:hypothetical protein
MEADKVLVYFMGDILTPSNSMQHMRGCLQGKTEEQMCFTSTILYTLLVENKNPFDNPLVGLERQVH